MINEDNIPKKSSGMIHSYITEHKFERINLLLDQFCHRCAQIQANSCIGCELSHRKNKVIIPFVVAQDTEQSMLACQEVR